MDVEKLREFCLSLPGVTEDVKWEDDLCFSVGNKMFCVSSMGDRFTASLKVENEEFDTLIETEGIKSAPYVGRFKWIYVEHADRFELGEWQQRIKKSYQLIKSKLPKTRRDMLN